MSSNMSFFSNAKEFTIGGHANFSSVGRDQITNNNDHSRHIKDSYNRSEVNNYGSHNQTYQSSRRSSRNPVDRPYHPRSQVSAPTNIGRYHEDEDDDNPSDSEESDDGVAESGPAGHRPRNQISHGYDNPEHRQRDPRHRPQPEMDRASGYPDQRSAHPSQQAYPARRHQPDPYSSQSRQPPLDEGYYEQPPYTGHAPNPPYEREGYYPQNARYGRSDAYAPRARPPPPPEEGYYPQPRYSQQPPHEYQNPSPWQQRSGPPRDWEAEPNGQYSRAPPSQYSHHPHPYPYHPQDDQQSFPPPNPPPPSLTTGVDEEYGTNDYRTRQPMMRASPDDPNGQRSPHVEAPTARWGSNNPFRNRTMADTRVATAPPSTTTMRSPPSDYPENPLPEDVEMAPPGVSSGQGGYPKASGNERKMN
ncbi:hypothetical protein PM082_002204 [Marasmius tenuissimus]|nr:hypothetical protein PM082_002204 [Marasmius tenuissimus]